MTMPGPPPYGASSTVRCASMVQLRRSCTRTSSSPRSRALPSRREPERGEVVGEDRDDVDRASGQPPAARPRRSERRRRIKRVPPPTSTLRHDLGRRTGTSELGTRPAGGSTSSVTARGVQHVGDPAEHAPVPAARASGRRSSWSYQTSSSGGRPGRPRSLSMTRRTPRRASAAVRSATPAKWTSSRPVCSRHRSTVSGPASGGSVRSTEPGANLSRARRCAPPR